MSCENCGDDQIAIGDTILCLTCDADRLAIKLIDLARAISNLARLFWCEDCGNTRICQHCAGSGNDQDNPGNVCPVCLGRTVCPYCAPEAG